VGPSLAMGDAWIERSLPIPGPASNFDHFPTTFSVIGITVADDMLSQKLCTPSILGEERDLTEKDNPLSIRAAPPTTFVTKIRYSQIMCPLSIVGTRVQPD